MREIKLPLFFSFYFLIFQSVPIYGTYFQTLSLLLLMFQNFITLMKRNRGTTNFPKSKSSALAMSLIFLIPLQSLLNNVANPNLYYTEYSILFFVVALSIFILINTVEFHLISNSFVFAAIATVLTVFITQFGALRETLSITIDPLYGMVRFMPFDLHPNLGGHIFGGFTVVFFCYFLYLDHKVLKIGFLALTALAMVLCLATASRGGTLSAVIAMTSIVSLAVWQDKENRKNLFLFFAFVLLVLFLAIGFDKIIGYLSSILAVDSEYRGVNSGLSGRTDNWAKLINTCFSSLRNMMIGNGLRTGSDPLLGYDIDNGYLTLLYEMGLISSTIFLFLMLSALNKLRKSLLHAPTVLKSVAFGMFVFIFFESIVARYLLSIGNPVSLFMIYCLLGLRTILKTAPAPQVAARVPAHQLMYL